MLRRRAPTASPEQAPEQREEAEQPTQNTPDVQQQRQHEDQEQIPEPEPEPEQGLALGDAQHGEPGDDGPDSPDDAKADAMPPFDTCFELAAWKHSARLPNADMQHAHQRAGAGGQVMSTNQSISNVDNSKSLCVSILRPTTFSPGGEWACVAIPPRK